MPNLKTPLFALLLVQFVSFGADAARWGLASNASIYFDCTASGGCRGNAQDVYGSVWQSFDSSLTNECAASYGTASVVIEMTGSGQVLFPRIHGVANSIGSNSHFNSAWGTVIEGYRYTGQTAAILEFEGALSGTSNGTTTSEGLDASVYFFKENGFVYYPHLPTLLYETTAQAITNFNLRITQPNSGSTQTAKVTVPVQPGERIYMYAELMIAVNRVGGSAITVDGLQISSPQNDLLVSQSLEPPTNFSVLQNGSSYSITMSPTRRPFSILQSTLLSTDWTTAPGSISTNEFGFSLPISTLNSQQFFRALLN